MRRCFVYVAVLVAYAAPATIALAADSASTSSAGAREEGGIAGDPRGAISALGGKTQNDFKPGTNKVDVPDLGGNIAVDHVGGAPPGISGRR